MRHALQEPQEQHAKRKKQEKSQRSCGTIRMKCRKGISTETRADWALVVRGCERRVGEMHDGYRLSHTVCKENLELDQEQAGRCQ